jgi:uncharacterized membrane protein (DUF485 family)
VTTFSSISPDVASDHEALAQTPEFGELRRRYRGFAFPATVIFLAWYLLYVVMSMFAGDFMGTRLVGNINVALVFGLLQFLTTFAIAALYSRFSNTHLDPLAEDLRRQDAQSRGEARR